MTEPLASVIIPMYREKDDIAGCIEAVGHQDCGSEAIELILVDGCSEDRTLMAAEDAARKFAFAAVRPLSNPARSRASNLNLGLACATGSVIVRVDARSRIPPHYVRTCCDVLATRPDVGVVGGAQIARPRSTAVKDLAIARALQNRWWTGLSRYRWSTRSGSSDTVWMGVFRAEELEQQAGWRGEAEPNEDYDLNRRYREAGFVVWFEAGLQSDYLPRASFGGLAAQHFSFGRAKGRQWSTGGPIAARQVVLVVLPPFGLAALVQAIRRRPAAACALVAAILLGVDAAGGSEGHVNVRTRVAAIAAMGVIGGCWWVGVGAGFARGLMQRSNPAVVPPAAKKTRR